MGQEVRFCHAAGAEEVRQAVRILEPNYLLQRSYVSQE